ncbi:MAG: hypothetical protein KDD56_02080 [Bdellovibrionales bacterium]|nr:hypothetical protein [Bdellovibrionales bacterium]
MDKKDLTSVDNSKQGTGKAANSFPSRTPDDNESEDPRWIPEGRPRTGAYAQNSVEDMLNEQGKSFFDYILIFFGYVLPILAVLAACIFFLNR